ncbi:MAG: methyltransferase domain-containing protein [Pseudomonadota bacterium]
MYDIVSKAEYWQWLDEKVNLAPARGVGLLKHIQDTFILSALKQTRGQRILEFGGGDSRVLKKLSKSNECWNADKFEGAGAGPTRVFRQRGVKTVKAFLGDFDEAIPADYFDYVISISVVEHVPSDEVNRVFQDCARILKPGGSLLQAIDLYLPDFADKDDPEFQFNRSRVALYLRAAEKAGLVLKEPATLEDDVCFRGFHASNSDATLYSWNSVAPNLRRVRERAQSVCLKAWWVKPACKVDTMRGVEVDAVKKDNGDRSVVAQSPEDNADAISPGEKGH